MQNELTQAELLKVTEILLSEAVRIGYESDLVRLEITDYLLSYYMMSGLDDGIEQLMKEYGVLEILPSESSGYQVSFSRATLRRLHASFTTDFHWRGNVIAFGNFLLDEKGGWLIHRTDEDLSQYQLDTYTKPIRFLLALAEAQGDVVLHTELARKLDINGFNESEDNTYHGELIKGVKNELKNTLRKQNVPANISNELMRQISSVRNQGYRLII